MSICLVSEYQNLNYTASWQDGWRCEEGRDCTHQTSERTTINTGKRSEAAGRYSAVGEHTVRVSSRVAVQYRQTQ